MESFTPRSPWIRTSPPAKLNLFLEVLGRRADGFHEIDSVMMAVDWRDELGVRRVAEPGVRLQVGWLPNRASVAAELGLVGAAAGWLDVPTGPENLVHRVLTLVQQRWDLPGGFQATLGKRIPSGAGMGGASSDAAAAIRLAHRAIAASSSGAEWTRSVSLAERESVEAELAASVGSDVNFFLQRGAVARAAGRGERLTSISSTARTHFVVMYPPESVSTAKVYAALGLERGQSRRGDAGAVAEPMIAAIERHDLVGIRATMHNALQDATRGLSSRIDQALQCFSNVGLTSAMMTGSGSACFALADSADAAVAAAERLRVSVHGGALIRAVTSCSAAPETFSA